MNLNSSNASYLNALTFNVNNFSVLNLQMNISVINVSGSFYGLIGSADNFTILNLIMNISCNVS